MAFKKKTWADRMVEYAGRRKLTNISTEQSIICDVERSEGTISKEGDAFSSQNMNDLEQRIEDGFTEVKQTTDGINQNLAGLDQKLSGVEYGTVTVSSTVNTDLKYVYKRNNIAYLCIHGKTAEDLYANGTGHFQISILPPGDTYIPYFIQKGDSTRVQMALIDKNGLISLTNKENINSGETFLFYTNFLLG